MKAVSNTSPLISLILVDKLYLVGKIFDEFYIPQAVFNELSSHNEILTYRKDLLWLESKTLKVSRILHFNNIDYGEIEAISLAFEIKSDLLLIDDKVARSVAENLKIKCIGSLGLLYMAKVNGYLSELRPVFLDLLSHKRYYAKSILNLILERAGEKKL